MLNQLSVQGLDQFLAQVYQTLDEIGSFVYGNFPGPGVCSSIKVDAAFLAFALTILGFLCRTGVLIEVCGIVAIIAFVVGVIIFLIKAFFCGF